MVAGWDNIPVVSWLILRGRCRGCRAGISWRYPAVEIATAAFFSLCCWYFSLTWVATGWALFCFLLLGLAVMDAETFLLPDAFTLPGLALGLLFAGLRGGLTPEWGMHGSAAAQAAGRSMIAAAAAAAVLLLIIAIYWLARRRMGMGFGDVKLLAMVGAWLGLRQTALTLLLAVVAGAVYGMGWIAWSRKNNPPAQRSAIPLGQVPIPFGTMLCLAALYSVFLGQRTLHWYLQFFP